MRISRLIAASVATLALLALPAAAQATLAYVKVPLNSVVYAAADNGSGAHKIGPGSNPRVSPDGESIAYLHEGPGHAQELKLAPAAGGAGRTLLAAWRESFYLAFTPDSKTIAALRGPEIGKLKLVLIDVASGSQKVVASGYFNGFSFSPDGDELVYAQAANLNYPAPTDLYRVATSGGRPVRLTKDHNSLDPLWGPDETIVFVKQLGAKKRKYGPKNELFMINPSGKGQKRLTNTVVDPLLQGLYPTQWSANGSRLLAEFEGQDTSYAVTVNPKTGAQHALDKRNQGESGFVGTAISKDGGTVLGYTGGFDPGTAHNVATIPYGGGKAKILVKNAYSPDWSR
jgi:Tol biopolymer transport system component